MWCMERIAAVEFCDEKETHILYTPNERIKEYREVILKISQEEYAEQTGIDLQRLKRIEAKKIKAKLQDVVAISDKYGISTDFLVGNKRLPAPTSLDAKQNEVWDMLEKLPDEELWEVCKRLGKELGIPITGEMPKQ